ncbi:hypothetical protein BDZ89DRAFT_1068044 [Hymenopellis radicata]|nr:hypothetical protein BDZ89DRAFT_1068044 [Hymenopellis radicata]
MASVVSCGVYDLEARTELGITAQQPLAQGGMVHTQCAHILTRLHASRLIPQHTNCIRRASLWYTTLNCALHSGRTKIVLLVVLFWCAMTTFTCLVLVSSHRCTTSSTC